MVPYVTMIHEYIIVRHIPIVTGLNSAFVPEVPFILIERNIQGKYLPRKHDRVFPQT